MTISKKLHAGDLIKEMRIRSGKTKAEAGALLNTSSSRIGQMEAQADIRLTTLADVANALGYEITIRKKQK